MDKDTLELKAYRDYHNTIATAEKDVKIEIAEKLLKRNMPLEFIAEDTRLSQEIIQELEEKLNTSKSHG